MPRPTTHHRNLFNRRRGDDHSEMTDWIKPLLSRPLPHG